MARRRGRKRPTLGELIIEGAGEALAHKRGDLVARTTTAPLTVREVEVVPPPEFNEVDVRRVRERLGLSQAVFADLIGASASTIRAWERGARQPSDMARRLLELAERQPEIFEDALVPTAT